jgi:hypothetical protein
MQMLLLFLGPQSVDIASIAAKRASECMHGPDHAPKPYALVVLDGTWQFANEMYKAVQGRLLPPDGPAQLVHLPGSCATAGTVLNKVGSAGWLLDSAPEVQAQGDALDDTPACDAELRSNACGGTHVAEDGAKDEGQGPHLLLRTEPFVCSCWYTHFRME